MTRRYWIVVASAVLGVAFAAKGVAHLIEGDTGTGAFNLVIGVGWLGIAAYRWNWMRQDATPKSERDVA